MTSLHQMPFGAEATPNGIRFSLWAPDARRIQLQVDDADPIDVAADDDGFARVIVEGVGAGARYSWTIDERAGIPDPVSRFQPDGVFGPSLVTDPTAFPWRDQDWTGRPWDEAVVYEAHVGAATSAGTFDALTERLDAIADLGVTVIELMPIAECPGAHNWGYDGVLPFAPNSAYGAPDDLKRLIDEAHQRGLSVILDVVYNHFGPSGNFLPLYAQSFFTDRHQTPWGAAIDFDATHRRAVRDFVIHNALYWIEEFHFDGLRLDAVHAIKDDSDTHVLTEIAESARKVAGSRRVHLVLENEHNAASWLTRTEDGRPRLYDAQWNDDIHHCWHVLLTGEREGYYEDFADAPLKRLARCLTEGFAYQGEPSLHAGGRSRGESSGHLPPQAFVSFLQNHDQVGNRAMGERLSALCDAQRLETAHAMLLLAPQTPMLFMGEEWSASTPFQFFVDFSDDPDLSRAVREGRQREFARFAAFADEKLATKIPDPTAPATFQASVLRWEERVRAPFADKLAQMRELLSLRHSHVVPLAKSGILEATSHVDESGALDALWSFAGGALQFQAYFGEGEREVELASGHEILWSSPRLSIHGAKIKLQAWTAMISKGPARGAA